MSCCVGLKLGGWRGNPCSWSVSLVDALFIAEPQQGEEPIRDPRPYSCGSRWCAFRSGTGSPPAPPHDLAISNTSCAGGLWAARYHQEATEPLPSQFATNTRASKLPGASGGALPGRPMPIMVLPLVGLVMLAASASESAPLGDTTPSIGVLHTWTDREGWKGRGTEPVATMNPRTGAVAWLEYTGREVDADIQVFGAKPESNWELTRLDSFQRPVVPPHTARLVWNGDELSIVQPTGGGGLVLRAPAGATTTRIDASGALLEGGPDGTLAATVRGDGDPMTRLEFVTASTGEIVAAVATSFEVVAGLTWSSAVPGVFATERSRTRVRISWFGLDGTERPLLDLRDGLHYATAPVLSPDEQHLAFVAYRTTAGQTTPRRFIVVVDVGAAWGRSQEIAVAVPVSAEAYAWADERRLLVADSLYGRLCFLHVAPPAALECSDLVTGSPTALQTAHTARGTFALIDGPTEAPTAELVYPPRSLRIVEFGLRVRDR